MPSRYLIADIACVARQARLRDFDDGLISSFNAAVNRMFSLEKEPTGKLKLVFNHNIQTRYIEDEPTQSNVSDSLEGAKKSIKRPFYSYDVGNYIENYEIILELEADNSVKGIYLYPENEDGSSFDRTTFKIISIQDFDFQNSKNATSQLREAMISAMMGTKALARMKEHGREFQGELQIKSDMSKIDRILTSMRTKIDQIDRDLYPQSYEEADKLVGKLNDLKNSYYSSNMSPVTFLSDCQSLILKSKPILQKDLGWGDYLDNAFNKIINAIIKGVTFGQVSNYLSLKKTELEEIVDKSARQLDSSVNEADSPSSNRIS